ncbi:MAG TPA: dienelactone hydrolase family protein [Longimicrobiales bacterium]
MSSQEGHAGQPVLRHGAALESAAAAMVMLHGRGANARDILGLAHVIDRPQLAYVAPDAARSTWYPYSFMAPIGQNEPWLSSALEFVGQVVAMVGAAGIPAERTLILGFSQGACLTLEFTARNARRYGGIAALTGGLIGPDGTPRDYAGSLDGTPVFVGSGDPDPHIPVERVHESERVLARMGANVTTRIYPGIGHTVIDDEIEHVRALIDAVIA